MPRRNKAMKFTIGALQSTDISVSTPDIEFSYGIEIYNKGTWRKRKSGESSF